jgi:hypothetical protein
MAVKFFAKVFIVSEFFKVSATKGDSNISPVG